MARVRGNITSYVTGKISGIVNTRNKSGQVIREKVIPTNANTQAQKDRRGGFALVNSAWITIQASSQQAWNAYAARYFKPKHKKKRSSYSGFQAFASLNNALNSASDHLLSMAFSGNAATATFSPLNAFISDPPTSGFSSIISDSSTMPLPYNLSACEINADGSGAFYCVFSTSQSSAPTWKNPSSDGKKVSYNIYLSGNLSYASGGLNSGEKFFIGNTGTINSVTAWGHSHYFGLKWAAIPDYIAKLKGFPTTNQVVRMTIYACSEDGNMNLVGSKSIVVG